MSQPDSRHNQPRCGDPCRYVTHPPVAGVRQICRWLAAGYLRRLRRAAWTMPRARRRELLGQIAAHIAEARAAGAVPLRRVLDDLGDPGDIAATGRVQRRLGVREVAVVILLPAG